MKWFTFAGHFFKGNFQNISFQVVQGLWVFNAQAPREVVIFYLYPEILPIISWQHLERYRWQYLERYARMV
jgi:hypothetical protein